MKEDGLRVCKQSLQGSGDHQWQKDAEVFAVKILG